MSESKVVAFLVQLVQKSNSELFLIIQLEPNAKDSLRKIAIRVLKNRKKDASQKKEIDKNLPLLGVKIK